MCLCLSDLGLMGEASNGEHIATSPNSLEVRAHKRREPYPDSRRFYSGGLRRRPS